MQRDKFVNLGLRNGQVASQTGRCQWLAVTSTGSIGSAQLLVQRSARKAQNIFRAK